MDFLLCGLLYIERPWGRNSFVVVTFDMDGLQHQYFCSLFYFFLIQYLMVSALWNEDTSIWDAESESSSISDKKSYSFFIDRNPCYVNYYGEKCRIYRKQFVNDFFDQKSRNPWEREKKLSRISVSLNARTCPCEYNTTYINLGDNDYFPSKILKVNCGFTKNAEKCQKHGWCQKKEWIIDVLKRQSAVSSDYASYQRTNVIPNDLTDVWEIQAVKTTVACIWMPK